MFPDAKNIPPSPSPEDPELSIGRTLDMSNPATNEAIDRLMSLPEDLGLVGDGFTQGTAVEGARKTRGPGRRPGGPFDPRGCF